MNFQSSLIVAGLLLGGTLASAQSGIGTIAPDPTVALHVKTSAPTQDAMRLEGLRLGTSETNVVVTDAGGKLRYRPISDLTIADEWTYNGSTHIYARRAQAGGNDVVVTNGGRFGIGTTAPLAGLHVNLGGDLVTATATTGFRMGSGNTFIGMDENEIQAFEGNAPGRLNLNADGGSVIMGTNSGNSLVLDVFGRADIRGALDVYGRGRVRTLPLGVLNDDPINSDEIVTADAAGNLRKVSATVFNQTAGEWANHSSNDYIFARRAKELAPFHDVVVSREGEIGLGLTNPLDKIHVRNGGIRLQSTGGTRYGWGIGFGNEVPFEGVGTQDGARFYTDRDAFGGTRDALVFEKTDFNHSTVDGGFLFSTRGSGVTREDRVAIRGNGNVGIGTIDPRATLHVVGAGLLQGNSTGEAASEGILRIVDDYNPSINTVRGVQVVDNREFVHFGMEPNPDGSDGMVLWGDGQDQDLHFRHKAGNTYTNIAYFDGQNLNLGIGRTSTDNNVKLHVGGKVRIDDLAPGDLNRVAPDDELVTADANGVLRKVPASALFQTFEDDDWTINGANIYNKNIGNVGIGTTNPTFKFDVNGAMRLGVGNYFQYGASAFNRVTVADDNNLLHTVNTLYRFQSRAGVELMTIEGNTAGGIGIATTNPDESYGMDFAAHGRFRQNQRLYFGDFSATATQSRNYVYSPAVGQFYTRVNDLWSIRNNADDSDVLTVKSAGAGRVGVRTNAPSTDFDVDGQVRIRSLPNGATADQLVTTDVFGNLRKLPQQTFEGPWDRTTSGGDQTFLRNPADRVGIGTAAPLGKLHIVETPGTPAGANAGSIVLDHEDNGGSSSIVFRSRQNRGSDYAYINYSDNGSANSGSTENSLLEIGVQNDAVGNFQDDIAIMPSGRLGVNTRAPRAQLHVEGDARITTMPTVNNTTDFAVTVDNNGDLRKQPITQIRDNLGNHQMTQNLATNGFTLSNTGTTAGLRFSPQNSTMLSGRLQIGNLTPTWIDNNITGITSTGFAGNDGAVFAPVYTGSENSDLRLYILDNPEDRFSIWGNPCGSTICNEINNSKPVVSFRADGEIFVEKLKTGGGADQMVLADANGRLRLGGAPGTSPSTGGDNLGNHTATTNINLGGNAINGTNGFSLHQSRVNLPNGSPITWSSLYGTAITGDVQANGEGGATDLRFEAADDIYMRTNGSNSDLLGHINGGVIIRADDEFVFTAGTGGNDDFRFYTQSASNDPSNTNFGTERFRIKNAGQVQVFDLAGTGNRIVTAAPDGTLQVMSGSSTGLWDRDAANQETYLTNGNDQVGIGTGDPDASLHVRQNMPTNGTPVELRLTNSNGNGQTAIFFQENNDNGAGIRMRYAGNDNNLYIEDGAGTNRLMTFERDSESVGIGTANPANETALHVSKLGQGGVNNPVRLRVQNEFGDGVSGVEFMEGGGNIGTNNAMSLKYNAAGTEAVEFVRGDLNSTDVKLRVERNSGLVTVPNLGTGADKMVIADAAGVLRTRDFDAALWSRTGAFTSLVNSADNVGIGVATPTAKLHVAGSVRIEGLAPGAATDNFVVADAGGNLRALPASTFTNYWARAGAGELVLATASDRIGLGRTPDSGVKLHVGTGPVRLDGLGGTGTRIVVADALGTLATQDLSNFESYWRRDASAGHVRLAAGADFVGIGVATPAARLHVDGKVRLNDLAVAGGNRQVMADANGELYTVAPAAQLWARDVASQFTYAVNGGDRFGIGTSTPQQKLHIAGLNNTIRIDQMPVGSASDEVVVRDGNGDLRRVSASAFESPWVRDPSNNEIFQKNLADFVGIGTDDPRTPLHLARANGLGVNNALELTIQNTTNGGTAAIRFRDNASTNTFADNYNSMSLRWVGNTNNLEIANGSDSTFLRMRRENGRVAIGYNLAAGFQPARQLYVQGDIEVEDGRGLYFAEPNSFLRDIGGVAGDDDLMLRAADLLYLRGGNNQGIRINNDGSTNLDNIPNGAVGNNILVENGGNVRRIPYVDLRGPWEETTGNRVRLFDGANSVGIGVTPATGMKLHVGAGAVRLEDLSGTGTQMVVANNAGVLSRQAIPTFDNYWTRDGSLNRITTTNGGDQVVIGGNGTGAGALQATSRLYVNGIVQVGTLSGTGTRMVIALPNGQLLAQPVPTLVDTDDQTLIYNPGTGLLTISKSGSTVNLGTEASIDDQQLSISGNVLSLTNSPSVTLPANTDNQSLSYNAATRTLSISGSAPTVDLSGLAGPWTRTGTSVGLGVAGDLVGIGTTAPSARLHVNGSMIFQGLPAGADSDEVVSVTTGGNVRKITINQIGTANGLAAGKLTQNLATNNHFLAFDNVRRGILLAASGQVVIGDGSVNAIAPQASNMLTVRGGTYVGSPGTSTTIFGGNVTTDGKVTTATFRMTTGAAANHILTSDAAGNATWTPYNPATGTITSDERLKRDLAPMTGALDAIAQLRNVTYRYKPAAEAQGIILDTATHYGLIAQDVRKVFPHAVTELNGFLQLKERELTGILFAAANELREANADLDARNRRLEAELADMKAAKTELERDVHSLTAETRELQKNMTTVLRHLEAGKRVQAAEH